jgi:hypothetical protein
MHLATHRSDRSLVHNGYASTSARWPAPSDAIVCGDSAVIIGRLPVLDLRGRRSQPSSGRSPDHHQGTDAGRTGGFSGYAGRPRGRRPRHPPHSEQQRRPARAQEMDAAEEKSWDHCAGPVVRNREAHGVERREPDPGSRPTPPARRRSQPRTRLQILARLAILARASPNRSDKACRPQRRASSTVPGRSTPPPSVPARPTRRPIALS